MPEAQAETTQVVTPAAEPTTAPAIAVAEKPEVAAPITATTPEDAKPQTGETEKPKGKDFFIKLRHEQREAEKKAAADRIAELESKVREFESQRQTPAAKQNLSKPPSLLDDPEGYANWVREDALRGIREDQAKREAEAASIKANQDYRQSAENAAQWVLSQSHIKQDAALLKDVGELLNGELSQTALVDPKSAMELAYIRVCRAKGIDPFATGAPGKNLDATKGAASSGARPSAPASGKRVFNKGEAAAYISAVDPAKNYDEHKRRLDEVDEAYKEGRVKR